MPRAAPLSLRPRQVAEPAGDARLLARIAQLEEENFEWQAQLATNEAEKAYEIERGIQTKERRRVVRKPELEDVASLIRRHKYDDALGAMAAMLPWEQPDWRAAYEAAADAKHVGLLCALIEVGAPCEALVDDDFLDDALTEGIWHFAARTDQVFDSEVFPKLVDKLPRSLDALITAASAIAFDQPDRALFLLKGKPTRRVLHAANDHLQSAPSVLHLYAHLACVSHDILNDLLTADDDQPTVLLVHELKALCDTLKYAHPPAPALHRDADLLLDRLHRFIAARRPPPSSATATRPPPPLDAAAGGLSSSSSSSFVPSSSSFVDVSRLGAAAPPR